MSRDSHVSKVNGYGLLKRRRVQGWRRTFSVSCYDYAGFCFQSNLSTLSIKRPHLVRSSG